MFFPEYIPVGNQTRQFWRYDSLLGWSHQQGMTGTQRFADEDVTISINQHGLRDDEIGYERNPKYRMLLLGDSFGWGFWIDKKDRFTEVIEREIDTLEFINSSVAGYSTDQQLLYYKAAGYKYKPDAVVLLFCENDFLGNTVDRIYWYNKPYFEYSGDSLILQNVPVPQLTSYQRLRKFLSGRSYLLSFILKRLSFVNVQSFSYEDLVLDNASVITQKILLDLKKRVSTDNAELIVIAIPMPEGHRKALQKITEKNQIKFIDLTPVFNKSNGYAFPNDGHWNAKGHQIAASALINEINRGLLGK